ncbi:ScyD/ScyE family protein [Parvularcula oceani]|uniref:ScyD/ScyE family protein n=1 Tax=Parvularcula oceani TaxID=1247963 RepID=UPI00068DF354|nr:ScyD/ScyE family protein [Parvularcula oceani]
MTAIHGRARLSRGMLGVLAAASALPLLAWADPAAAATYTVERVLMDGLANPRGLTVGPDGTIWVAEAGEGGEGPSIVLGDGVTNYYGATGVLTRYSGGVQETVADGLPSLAPEGGFGASGIHDIAFGSDGTLYALFGFGTDPTLRGTLSGESGAELFGQLTAWNGTSFVPVADLAAFEQAENPDGADLNSNPWGLAANGGGFVVTDAGGNTVLTVAGDGTIETLAALPETANPLPFGPPFYQAVPTGVALGEDGEALVVQLTGFPFVEGAANVFSVGTDGSVGTVAGGFTNLIDVAFGEDGTIFALELDSDSLTGPEMIGSLYAIDDLGIRTLLITGLINPTSLALGPDGTIYVTENGLSPELGRVLELAPIPLPPALPMMAAGIALLVLARRAAPRRIERTVYGRRRHAPSRAALRVRRI